jgi:ATP-dependent exoDNAse (exonuclease V) beta subunit
MSVSAAALPADQAQRDAAIAERLRNVLIDAGAGTGKTTLLADRLIELIAPERSDGSPIPIEKIAAITFTRKAAGELRLRVREKLLSNLAGCEPQVPRATLLRAALAGLDTAHISTIHSFCDRLLRLRPVEAQLSPSYEVAEAADVLAQEAFHLLLEAAQAGRLDAELAGTSAAGFASEAEATIANALAAGFKRDTQEFEFYSKFGLDALVRCFIEQRDVPPSLPPAPRFSAKKFHEGREQFLDVAKGVTGGSVGARWVARLAATLRELKDEDDPARLLAALGVLARGPNGKTSGIGKGEHFDDDDEAWRVWKLHHEGKSKKEVLDKPLRERLLEPLHSWMSRRLIRLFPVVIALYGKVKARRRQLDQIDLLLRLRDVLVEHPDARAFYQGLFDHVFVDEFQDTDPLQAEIVLFLCEKKPLAKRWTEVELAPGRLTLVGDPKQSIYRFRRADITVYDQVRAHVGLRHCLSITLSTNFRSSAPLIEFLNDRFMRILGPAEEGKPLFDAANGTVRHQHLVAAPNAASIGLCVHSIPLLGAPGANAEEFRMLEAEALARYLRHLVESGATQITDPVDGVRRPLRFGDIAVLAISTWNLRMLLPQLDAFGIPHAVRGGRLLLTDPLHRQFLLALRAIADRDDGPAQAALHRPPFFSIDVSDLLHDRAARAAENGGPLIGAVDATAAARAREALALITDLRRERLSRSPGATARDLIELTAFGRALATGPNGEQRLEQVHEICRALDALAASEGLDYDGATLRLRSWIDDPIQLDPPHPIGDGALQILTVHQAKGLEFPVVVLWDGMAAWQVPSQTGAFRISRDGAAWSMQLDGLEWDEPRGQNVSKREKVFQEAERRRIVYVAATRARELLITASAGGAKCGRHIAADLLDAVSPSLISIIDPFDPGELPDWAQSVQLAKPIDVRPPKKAALAEARRQEELLATEWLNAAHASAIPQLAPTSVTSLAHREEVIFRSRAEDEEPSEKPAPARRPGRFGKLFGEVVHRAIGFKLSMPAVSVDDAVARCADQVGLKEHLAEARGDVERTLATLEQAGLTQGEWRLEYPIWGATNATDLLQGFIDLLVVRPNGELTIIDFKTDAAPPGAVTESHATYVAQVRSYRDLLDATGVNGSSQTRCALLFTADGSLRFCDADG